MAIEQVSVTELPDDFTGDETRVMLDVREDDEWELEHIRGALHIPLNDVPARLDEIDIDAELFIVCRSSGRSIRLVEYLEHVGYEGTVVRGGMVAWIGSGKPVVSGADDAGAAR